MDELKFEIKDKIKFAACEEVVKRFAGETVLKNSFSVSEFMAYIVDTTRGEECIAFLAHFAPKSILAQRGKSSEQVKLSEITEQIRSGIREHNFNASGSREIYSKPSVCGHEIGRIKFDILKAAKLEKGYRHEVDYNTYEEAPQLTKTELVVADVLSRQFPSLVKTRTEGVIRPQGLPSEQAPTKK